MTVKSCKDLIVLQKFMDLAVLTKKVSENSNP